MPEKEAGMPTRPADEVFQELMSPSELARSTDKAVEKIAGATVARLREEAGLTQAQLAERLGVTQQAVLKMEWGDDIKLPTLSRALAALGASLYVHTPHGNVPLTTAKP